MKLVMKFGGSSVADAERIRHCAGLVRRFGAEHRVVTTVSALGGVTDLLLELAAAAGCGNRVATHTLLGEIRAKHECAARELACEENVRGLLDRLDALVLGISAVGELTARSKDAVVSFGERLSARLMAAALGGQALTGAEAGIVTDDHFGEADPLMELTLYQVRERLEPLLNGAAPVVVTGFLGATQHGVTTTLGRGGSDYTATILGSALKADEVWIWSDVNGLMTADPRTVPEARLLDHITFAESIEMGQFGAKSMHPRALEPAVEHRIPVRMRSTFNPDCPGTLITDGQADNTVARCVLLLKKVALLNVSGASMTGRPGTAARLFGALADANVNILVISQSVSEAGISIVVARDQLERAEGAIQAKLLRVGAARRVDVNADVAVVAVVGSGMTGTPGVAARVFTAVADHKVNVRAIAQGSSELSVCFVVSESDGPTAVRALHHEFGLGQ